MSDAPGGPRVAIDGHRCRGRGVCLRRLPELFEADGEGRSRIRGNPSVEPFLSELRAVAFDCPHQAIELVGDSFFDFPDVGP